MSEEEGKAYLSEKKENTPPNEKEGIVSLQIKDGKVFFVAHLWLLWTLIVIALVLIGRSEVIALLEDILKMLG